jgi:hypothetical protein
MLDQPEGKLKRTIAAAVAAVTASTSIWLGATVTARAAGAGLVSPDPSATLRVVPGWTYENGGRLAVIAGCSKRGDIRVISSKLLPKPVRMTTGRKLLIKVAGKTKPGKYTIVLLCGDKHAVPDSVDVKPVRIYKYLGAFQQPDQPFLPAHFIPDVTVTAGPPAAVQPKKGHPKKKGH